MLLIPCPWCGPRDEHEFAYGGEAPHRAARRSGDAAHRRGVGATTSSCARTRKGAHLRALVHAHGCRRWFNVARDTVTHEIYAVYKMGEPPPRSIADERRSGCMSQVNRLPQGGRIDRTQPLRFTFNGKRYQGHRGRHARLGAARQRRACWSAAASSTTARAASSPPARRSRTRWCSSAGRRTEPNAARHRRSSSTTASSPTSQNRWPSLDFDFGAVNGLLRRSSCRPASTTRPSCGRRASG